MVDENYNRIADVLKFSKDREQIENAVRDLIRLKIDSQPILNELTPERRKEVRAIALPIYAERRDIKRARVAANLDSHHQENGATEISSEDMAALESLIR